MAVDWSTLPLDVLGLIALNLETFEDFIKFTVVCRCWNDASLSVKQHWTTTPVVPWLLLAENTKDNPDCVRKIFNLSNNKCYNFYLPETFGARCWGLHYGWVAILDHNFDFQLINPITKAQIHFPSLKPLEFVGILPNQSARSYQSWILRCFADRLIVLKVPQNDGYEFVVLVVHEYYQSLAFARQGDQSWTPIFVKSNNQMLDVVGMDDKLIAIYRDGSIVCWNIKEFNTLELIKPADYSPWGHEFIKKFNRGGFNHTYLVRSGSDLLMVLREKEDCVPDEDESDIASRTLGFEVYRFESKDKSWEKTEDLGEVALIVGGNSSMCVPAHTNGLKRNCIYFTDDECCYWKSLRKPGGHDMGVFEVETGNMQPFYEGDDIHSTFSPPTLFIPQL